MVLTYRTLTYGTRQSGGYDTRVRRGAGHAKSRLEEDYCVLDSWTAVSTEARAGAKCGFCSCRPRAAESSGVARLAVRSGAPPFVLAYRLSSHSLSRHPAFPWVPFRRVLGSHLLLPRLQRGLPLGLHRRSARRTALMSITCTPRCRCARSGPKAWLGTRPLRPIKRPFGNPKPWTRNQKPWCAALVCRTTPQGGRQAGLRAREVLRTDCHRPSSSPDDRITSQARPRRRLPQECAQPQQPPTRGAGGVVWCVDDGEGGEADSQPDRRQDLFWCHWGSIGGSQGAGSLGAPNHSQGDGEQVPAVY